MTAMTTRYLANKISRCQTVSTEGRCASAAAAVRARLSVSMPLEATADGDAIMSGWLRAMQAMRRIVATHIAIEHHAFRFGHQHAAAMTLDHRFNIIRPALRGIAAARAGFARLLAQALEQHPGDGRDDEQKNYFSHLLKANA